MIEILMGSPRGSVHAVCLLVVRINSDPGPLMLLPLPVAPRTGSHHLHLKGESILRVRRTASGPPGQLVKMQIPRPSIFPGSGSLG